MLVKRNAEGTDAADNNRYCIGERPGTSDRHSMPQSVGVPGLSLKMYLSLSVTPVLSVFELYQRPCVSGSASTVVLA